MESGMRGIRLEKNSWQLWKEAFIPERGPIVRVKSVEKNALSALVVQAWEFDPVTDFHRSLHESL